MITLYKFAPAWGLSTSSPFALKIEAYLRMADIDYVSENVARPQSAPKGTIPYIQDGETVIGDSGFIVDYLKAEYGDNLNSGLSSNELAIAHATKRMLEENLARILGCTRWLTEENWPTTKEMGFGRMPEDLREKISAESRRKIEEDMKIHGIGRHSKEEIQQIGLRDVMALETLLDHKDYVMGSQPSEVDASAFGIVAQYVIPPLKCKISDYARQSPTISDYIFRTKDRFFPELKTSSM